MFVCQVYRPSQLTQPPVRARAALPGFLRAFFSPTCTKFTIQVLLENANLEVASHAQKVGIRDCLSVDGRAATYTHTKETLLQQPKQAELGRQRA